MKQYFSFSFLVIFSAILFSSCEEQKEQLEDRDAILGMWDVVETIVTVNPSSAELRATDQAHLVQIARSEIFADEVFIYNFHGIREELYLPAAVDGKTVTISEITLDDFIVHGQGTISSNSNTITWTYWVEDPQGEEEQYSATYTRRQ
ncbi:MAG: hypothetical protein JXR60_02365 [Bacteroidales bacterium]|nr:hypothetical protein [Bacteroidales bacterium]